MKKIFFIVMVLFVANFAFSDTEDEDIKALLQKDEDYYKEFEETFKNLQDFDSSKRAKDTLKQLQDMVDRQKKLVDMKIEEIQMIEKAGRYVTLTEFNQLRDLMNRYHQMTVNLNNWVNNKKE